LLLDSFFYTRYFVRSWSLTPFFTKDILWELAACLIFLHKILCKILKLDSIFYERYFVRTCSFPHVCNTIKYFSLTIFFHSKHSLISSVWLLFLTQDTLLDLAAWLIFLHKILCKILKLDSIFYERYFVRTCSFPHVCNTIKYFSLTIFFHSKYSLISSVWLLFLTQDTLWDFAAWLPFSHKILCEITAWPHFVTQITMWLL
jgi:sensor histidine kinase YesM